ncbi:MAG: mandelate racemase/muconate lactonizing enzyme family protein [Anaerolineae bacterium]
MMHLTIRDVERLWVNVPFKERHARHLTRENWDWTVFEVLRVRTDSDLVGYGETMPYYTWGRVPQEQIDRVIGHSPFEFLWDDKLGAGLQMAIYDLAGKAMGVPCYKLLAPKVRDWCPVSWWSNDMSTEDWVDEIREALALGYMSAKLKARPWRDYLEQLQTLASIVPSDFTFDADFNSFLHDVGTAAPYLQELEKIPAVNLFETPIPQEDVEGNAVLRRKISRPIAMHYGSPAIRTALHAEVCDGFVVGGGAYHVRTQAELAAQMNKPFFLQLVGTGLTTAFMLHFGATCSHAVWPAVTCHEILEDDLLCERIDIQQGFARVPEAPGLGVEIDEEAIARYRVADGFWPEPPRNLYRVTWPSGAQVTYPVGKGGVWDDFTAGNQPLFHPGVRLEIVPDDGSRAWQELHDLAVKAPVRSQAR